LPPAYAGYAPGPARQLVAMTGAEASA